MSKLRLSRRAMLRGAGGIAISLPFLEIMTPSRARAEDLPHRKRLVVVYSPHGRQQISNNKWKPTGTGMDFQLGELHSGLEPYKSDLAVLSGVELTSARNQGGNGHSKGTTHCLTCTDHLDETLPGDMSMGTIGYAGGLSLDQRAAEAIAEQQIFTFPSLQFGVQSGPDFAVNGATTRSYISYAGPGEPIPAEDNPGAMFDKLFGDFDQDAGELAKRKAQRRSVLDMVSEDFDTLNPKLGTEDQQRLDKHLSKIREIEQSIDVTTGDVSAACAMPDIGTPVEGYKDNGNYPLVGEQQTDLLTMALACDMTRVATFQWSTGQSVTKHTWIPGAGSKGHHGLTHDGSATQQACEDITRWYADRVRDLIASLAAIEEPDGTSLLSNTVVLWVGGEMGHADAHSFADMPYVVFGQCGGAITTGQHLDLGPDRPNNDLMLTLLHAMGIEDETFGKAGYNTGVISQLLA